jgi:hypothetical protein
MPRIVTEDVTFGFIQFTIAEMESDLLYLDDGKWPRWCVLKTSAFVLAAPLSRYGF